MKYLNLGDYRWSILCIYGSPRPRAEPVLHLNSVPMSCVLRLKAETSNKSVTGLPFNRES